MRSKKRKRRYNNLALGSTEHANGFEVPDKVMESHPIKQRHSRGPYWYVKAKISGPDGRQRYALLGPYATEEEAYNMGYSKVDGTFDVFSSPYADRNRVTQQGKHGRMKNGEPLSKSLERWVHKVPQIDV